MNDIDEYKIYVILYLEKKIYNKQNGIKLQIRKKNL